MRRSAALEAILKSGRYLGNNRANAYITANNTWHLTADGTSGSKTYRPWRMPFRHWANTGTDVPVPLAVKDKISINRSITEACAQLNLTLRNVHPAGGPNIPGQGYFTVRQGAPQAVGRWPDATASMWGQFAAGSYGLLGAGSLLKTWQGYGGYHLGLEDAVDQGYVVQTGAWIVDDVNETDRGEITVVARDVGQLLTDQDLYPPFMPVPACYPTQFYSRTWNEEVNDDPDGFPPTSTNYDDLCCDTSTEIFTQRGWLTWDEVKVGDQTLSIDPATGRSEWTEVLNVYSRAGSNDMIRMAGTSHDSFTTEGHKWLVTDRYGKATFRTTRDLNTDSAIPVAAARADLPSEPVEADDMVELIGWFWTEGYIRRAATTDRIEISQSSVANPDYVAKIDAAATRLFGAPGRLPRRSGLTNEMAAQARSLIEAGVSAAEASRRLGISDVTLARWAAVDFEPGYGRWSRLVRPNGIVVWTFDEATSREFLDRAPNKVLDPEFLGQLTGTQLDLLIDTSMAGDGHTKKNGTRTLAQASEERIDAFTYLCAMAGYATTVKHRPGSSTWTACILKQKVVRPAGTAKRSGARMKITRERYEGVVWCPSTKHRNWLARRNGTVYFTGNCDIVELLALWAGFHMPDKSGLMGLREDAGIDSPSVFKADYFDKKFAIDAIQEILKIVGYRVWVNPEGGLHITSQNIWQAGNRDYNGGHTSFCHEVDELETLTAITSSWTKRTDRSRVIVSRGNPQLMEGVPNATLVTNSGTPGAYGNQLHGMNSAAHFPVDRELSQKEMTTLAELTGIRMWFARHRTNVSAVANPLIDPDDQVLVWERTTQECYLERVLSMSTNYDEGTGVYTMGLDTMWMGPDNSGWEIRVGPNGNVVYN